VTSRHSTLDWGESRSALDGRGFAVLPGLISAAASNAIAATFDTDEIFRSHIEMRRHGFGEGEYKYYSYPLPGEVKRLRRTLYEPLSEIANGWSAKLNGDTPYPSTHDKFLETCHAAGQVRPTPLLLRYRAGDYNRLHQDLYGDIHFPIQVAILLDRPGVDFEGGEFVLTEQKPRSQSRATVVPLNQGDAVAFAVNERPAEGKRGYYRLKMRHGVSELHAGSRLTLGIIFHDAR